MLRGVLLIFLFAVEAGSFLIVPPHCHIHKHSIAESKQHVTLFSDAADTEISEIPEETSAEGTSLETQKVSRERERFTLFVGNLPFTTTIEEIRELFSTKGEVVYVNLPRHKESRQARGFAFVDMATKDDADKAMAELNGAELGNRMIRVAESVPRDQAQQSPKRVDDGVKKLYVGNIPFETTLEELKDFFGEHGEVKDVYIPMNRDGSPRGFAFVSLKEEDVEKTLEATNGMDFNGRPMVVSLPLPPGEKAQRRASFENRTKLYVGNLSFYTVADSLAELFEEFGTVHDCYLPEDPVTGSSRGFGFVTMDKEDAQTAIAETDGCELDGRIIRVNEALPRGAPRPDEDDAEDP